jgi:hypothetical protein
MPYGGFIADETGKEVLGMIGVLYIGFLRLELCTKPQNLYIIAASRTSIIFSIPSKVTQKVQHLQVMLP